MIKNPLVLFYGSEVRSQSWSFYISENFSNGTQNNKDKQNTPVGLILQVVNLRPRRYKYIPINDSVSRSNLRRLVRILSHVDGVSALRLCWYWKMIVCLILGTHHSKRKYNLKLMTFEIWPHHCKATLKEHVQLKQIISSSVIFHRVYCFLRQFGLT